VDVGKYKTLADYQATGYQKDETTAKFMDARNLKHPDQAPTPQLQMVAVSGKMQRVLDAPEWKTLPKQYKIQVLGEIYDTHVISAFRANGIEPPEKGEWISRYAKNILSPEEFQNYNEAYKKNAIDHPAQAVDDRPRLGRTNIAISGIADEVANTATLVANTLRFPFNTSSKLYQSPSNPIKRLAGAFDAYASYAHRVNTDALSAFQPQQGFMDWTANTAGHLVGATPAFLGIGKLGEALKIGAVTEAVVPKLAERAALSRGFKTAVAALDNAGQVFVLDRGEGASWEDSFKNAAYTLAFAGAIHGAVLRFNGAKLAVGGEPFVNDLETRADMPNGEKVVSRPGKLISLISEDDPDSIKALIHEREMRHQVAVTFFPKKAKKFPASSGRGALYNNLSKNQRVKVQTFISSLSKENAAKFMPITNPEVVEAANQNTLDKFYKENPGEQDIDKEIEKLTGIPMAKAVTEAQAELVGKESGLTGATAKLKDTYRVGNRIINEEGEYEPSEGSYTTLAPNYRVDYRNATPDTPFNQLVAPRTSAEDFINGTQKYPPDSQYRSSGKFEFEGPEHHLLWIATQADLKGLSASQKALVRNRAFKLLKSEMGTTIPEAKVRGGWLREHYENIKTNEPRLNQQGVLFASTKLGPRRYATVHAKTLYNEDTEASAKAWLMANFKKNPKLRAEFQPFLDGLNKLKNKQQSFQGVKNYRELIEKIKQASLGVK
jgi:hypothetical protein